MQAITLQNCLDASSFFLGESGTPTSEVTKRTEFANEAKEYIRNLRNWTFEKKYPAAINIVSGTSLYTLATDMKNRQSLEWVKVTDSNNNNTYYTPVTESEFNAIVNNSQQDQVYLVKGNNVDGYTITLNPAPSANVTNGLNYCYYFAEPDFALTTDTTRIPKREAIAWYITAKVLYGYREQSQYQLAMNEFNGAIEDMANEDMKGDPYVNQQIQNFRQYSGASTDLRTYY